MRPAASSTPSPSLPGQQAPDVIDRARLARLLLEMLDGEISPLLKDLEVGYRRGSLSRTPTARQVDVLAAFVAVGVSVADAAAHVGIRSSTAKRRLADLRARSGLTATNGMD